MSNPQWVNPYDLYDLGDQIYLELSSLLKHRFVDIWTDYRDAHLQSFKIAVGDQGQRSIVCKGRWTTDHYAMEIVVSDVASPGSPSRVYAWSEPKLDLAYIESMTIEKALQVLSAA